MKKEKSTSKKNRLNHKTIGHQYWNQTIRTDRLKEHYQIGDKKLSRSRALRRHDRVLATNRVHSNGCRMAGR